MKSRFKNIFNKKTTIITVVVVLICLVIPITTHADLGTTIARGIFGFLGNLVVQITSLFVGFGATFLETMVDIGLSGTSRTIAETGWRVSRDFANMIFILIMIMIAFGTILRVEQYGVKKLLPKLVIVALLINFSMPISYLFIDLSNLTAKSFISSSKGTSEDIRSKLVDAVKANIMLLPRDCADLQGEVAQQCEKENQDIKTAQDQQKWYDVIIAQIIACIFMGLAAFSLIAAAIMMIIRMLYLAILVMLSPLAFMCYMIPSLSRHWKEWWSNLLKWCFFAPVFTFFFWLSLTTVSGINETLSASKNTLRSPTEGMAFMSKFLANGSNVLGYFLFIGLIMGGLIVAQKMGIAGANVAMSMVQKAKKGATGWMKSRFVTKPTQLAGGAAQRVVGGGLLKRIRLLKRIPGLKTYGAKMEARGKLAQQAMLKSKDVETAKRLYEQFSPEDLSRAMNTKIMTLTPAQKLALAQVASSDKYKDKIDSKAADRAADTLQTFGYGKEAKDLREARIDSEQNIVDLEMKMKEMQAKGELTNMSPKALADPRVIKLLAKLCSIEELDTIRNKSGKHNVAIKENLTAAANDPANLNDAEIQHAYASQTGDIETIRTRGHLDTYAATAGINAFRRDRVSYSKIPAASLPLVTMDLAHNIQPADLKETIQKMDPKLATAVVRIIKTLPMTHPNFVIVDADPWLKSLG